MLRPPSALPTVAALLILAAATSVSVGDPTRVDAATVQTGAGPDVPGTMAPPTPLVGDFDGDGSEDQLWYGPGASPDHAWYGGHDRAFSGRSVDVAEDYEPLVGDFNGDGRDDVFWYGPGAAVDHLWQGTSTRGFVGRSVRVGGTYQPLVADFNGDRRDDVFWYAPSGPDRVWFGTNGGFAAVSVAVTGSFTPVLGDFDGNGTSDVLWYAPGGERDYLWRGTWSRSFVGVSLAVDGTYTPVVGDYDGDGPDDVFWRAASGGVLWKGQRGGGFEGASARGVGTASPVAADFDGDGSDDLVWDNAGVGADRVWYGTSSGFAARSIRVGGSYTATPGDYDGDGRDDLFWFAAGASPDALWFAAPGRAFGSRPTTLDPLSGADAPFRQDAWVTQYEPYGYVAHALGPTPPDRYGRTFGYSNSLESFEHNYLKGFRVFESDWVRLADGTVLAAHNGTERRYGLPPGVTFSNSTRSQLDGFYTVGGNADHQANRFTPLFAQDLVDLLIAHPDAYVILDTKTSHSEIVAEFVRLTAGHPGVMDRLVPHVAGQAELDRLRAIYPVRNYILALYRTQAFNQFDDPAVVRFVQDNRVPAVMMWWGTRDPALSLSANMGQQRRYTPALVAALQAAGAVSYVHSLGDAAVVQYFAARGIGVYSNGPFPPFGIEPAPIEPHIEGSPLV